VTTRKAVTDCTVVKIFTCKVVVFCLSQNEDISDHSADDSEPLPYESPLDLLPMVAVFKRYLTTEAMQVRSS
jgi:hypothetical protein